MENDRIISGLFWKALERFGVLGAQFIIQVVLARLLGPDSYGLLAIMMVFISIANIFVQNGFSTALIQNEKVNEKDYSSVFWMTMVIALVAYIVIFLIAPFIGRAYNDEIVGPFRVLALILFPGALNSVQLAKVTREMKFRKIFYSNLSGAVISGIVGIIMAYAGLGLYSLVGQSLLNTVIVCIVMRFTSGFSISFVIDRTRIKEFFSFGWKLTVSSILNTITENIRSMAIGMKFDTTMLGYYERGMQFPQYGINVVQGTVQSVLLPAMSEQQNDRERARNIMRNAISLSAYLIFPMMAGLAAVSKSFVGFLLTEKWMASVPYMQIYCVVFAFWPVHVTNLQAMNSVGRSDLYLKLEIIKLAYGLPVLAIVLYFAKTPIAVAVSSLLLIPVGWFTNAYFNKRLIGYGFVDQVRDVAPSIALSLSMFVVVYLINKAEMGYLVTMCTQIGIGIIFYLTMSIVTKNRNYSKLRGIILNVINSKK